MSIFPLPVFEADADSHNRDARTDAEIYEALEAPSSIVVRFGAMKFVGEYPYKGDAKPGCGSKMVARTHRGIEVVEMLTTTCENAGCGKSVTRKEMLEYIENSGGKDFPFYTNGQILRVATIDDLNRFAELKNRSPEALRVVREAVRDRELDMKVVEIEPILGEEILTVYFMAEERIDFRELVRHLASHFKTRIEMRQVGARDEARLVADYERCGQHCCCKNFLKVLKPVSMRAAKTQKATLDPLKISGRCGRLMCCLRYEDQTYRELKRNLPHRRARVGTPYGPGLVMDGKILAQLVLVKLEHNDEEVAVPVESLVDPEECPQPANMSPAERAAFDARVAMGDLEDPLRGLDEADAESRGDDGSRPGEEPRQRGRGSRRRSRSKGEQQDAYRKQSQARERDGAGDQAEADTSKGGSRKRRRGRRGASKGDEQPQGGSSGTHPTGGSTPPGGDGPPTGSAEPSAGAGGGASGKKKRRRRRGKRSGKRRRGGGGGGGGGESGGPGAS